jgi:site-specific recombinase XerD
MSIGCKPLSDQEISLISDSMESLRDKCLFILGVKTGFRISELLSIKKSDCLQYNKVKASITVQKRNTKGKVASRSIPLTNEVMEVLKSYIQTLPKEQEYLFQSRNGNRLSRVQAWRVIKDAANKNNLEGKIATHSLRKTVAMRAYNESGKDLALTQQILGHKSINSTISYIQVSRESIEELFKKIQK